MEGVGAINGPGPVRAGPEVEDFANALDDCLSPYSSPLGKRDRILELPRKYYDNALRRLAQLRPNAARDGDVDMDVDDAEAGNGEVASAAEIKQVEREVQTWDLVRRLLPLRFPNKGSGTPPLSPSEPPASQPGLLHEFFLSNTVAQERRAVLQWLQTNASSGPDIDELARELQQNADRGDIIAHGWLHTRSSIKLRKSVTAWPHLLDRQAPTIATTHLNADGAPLVTQLDPDAPTRQGRKLEPQDEYFERSIWLGCFEHLRRGSSLEVIRDWCQERTEMWRSISTSALLLSPDNSEPSSETNIASLALWRRMCFGLARQGGCDDYERAVYGVLSGDIASVEKVSLTWDDFLFANYNALLRTQLDNFILGRCPPEVASNLTQSFSSFDAIQFHGNPETLEQRLIGSLESNKQIREEAIEPNKALQASLISKEIEEHLFEQGLVIASDAASDAITDYLSKFLYHSAPTAMDLNKEKFFTADQHDGLRIVAHVYLLIRLLQRLENVDGVLSALSSPEWRNGQENILAGYTNYLRLAGLQELIPLYCSILEPSRCFEVLSSNLITETDNQQRLLQLKLIKKAGIDVLRFVTIQAWLMYDNLGPVGFGFTPRDAFSILQASPPTSRRGRPIKPDFFGEEEDKVELKHEYLIRALEWLLLVDETWPKVFSIGTKVYKFFLKNLHLNAARRLMKRVPFSEVMGEQDEMEGSWFDDVEYWAQQLERSGIHDVAPEKVVSDARNFRDLEALVRALDNLETIGSLAELSNEAPSTNREFWGKVGDDVKAAKENMQPLLRSWLIAGIEEGDEELRELRQKYLPETVLAYVSALHFAGTGLSRDNLLECMELAAVIAERNSDLSASFVAAGRMKELVEAFAACSKALAITTGEKRAAGSSSKKLREMGWSRDLWSVKP